MANGISSSLSSSASSASCVLERYWSKISLIEKFSKKSIRPMTLKRLLQVYSNSDSAIIKSADWVREELSVRLSHRLYDFHRLPFVVLGNPYIRETYDTYIHTFDNLVKIKPVTTIEQEIALVKILEQERTSHDRTVDFMGEGLKQLKLVCPDVNMNSFLDRFFFFRIGRRIMIDHLLAMQNPLPGWAGCIHLECKPIEIIKQRVDDVRESCRMTYGLAPRYTIGGNVSFTFAFIPDHLAIIVTEILKNAMRATVEFYTLGNSVLDQSNGLITDDSELPEVRIEVYKGKREIVIKISDKGGGIPPNKLQDIWSFGYSTVNDTNSRIADSGGINCNLIRSDMAGYGFGLPLSKAIARYFGGDIHTQSCFGIGTDVYITLNHIGDQEEALFYEERPDLMHNRDEEYVNNFANSNKNNIR